MSTRRVKNNAAQRYDEHITGIGRCVADNSNENDHRSDQPFSGHPEQGAQAGIDKARMFSNADAKHRDQHNAYRMKVRKVCNHD